MWVCSSTVQADPRRRARRPPIIIRGSFCKKVKQKVYNQQHSTTTHNAPPCWCSTDGLTIYSTRHASTHVLFLLRREAIIPQHGRHTGVLCELPNHPRLRKLPDPLSWLFDVVVVLVASRRKRDRDTYLFSTNTKKKKTSRNMFAFGTGKSTLVLRSALRALRVLFLTLRAIKQASSSP